jgi:NADPH2:quinone reductase
MRAVVMNQYGGPEVLAPAEREAPVAGPGQLVVEVAAAGVNFIDVYQRQGQPPYQVPLPFVPGLEGAGTVAEVGPNVTGFAAGDTVAWCGMPGSYAERAVVPAELAIPVPGGVEPLIAAAVLLQGMTAHYLSHDTYPVAAGDPIVVHGAAGGVGLLLTQLVKMREGVVIATTSTAAKAEVARQAGADHVAGYDDFPAVAKRVSGGAGAAAVYDGIGQATFDASLAALRPRGCLVMHGSTSGPVPPFSPQRLSAGGSLFITCPTLNLYTATRKELLRRADDLFTWITSGRLSVRVGGTYPLADAARAHADLAARRTTGKLLLVP